MEVPESHLAVAFVLLVSLGSVLAVATVVTASHESITITEPTDDYFVGQAVNVTGEANDSVESVAVYARGDGDWQLLDVTRDGTADGDDTLVVDDAGDWSVRNLVLSEAVPLLSQPGDYLLGVVNATALDDERPLPARLSPTAFVRLQAAQVPLRVNSARLQTTFRTIDGQIATEDAEVEVRGSAQGTREILIVLVDSRGRVATDRYRIPRGNGSFDVDVPLRAPDGSLLARGPIYGSVLAPGRDGVIGDGTLPNGTNATLETIADYLQGLSSTLDARQVRELFAAESVNDTGSDDRHLTSTFEFADSRARITTVGPADAVLDGEILPVTAGEQLVIAGSTNLSPDDNTIRVDAIAGPTAGLFPTVWTHDWDASGEWSVAFDTAGVEPGIYAFTVEAGERTDDRVRVRIEEPGGAESVPENATPGGSGPTPENGTAQDGAPTPDGGATR